MGIVYPRLSNVHHILDDLGSVHLRKSLRICRSFAYSLSSDCRIRTLCMLCILSYLLDYINPCKLRSIRHRSRWVVRNKVFREGFSLALRPLVSQEVLGMFVNNIRNPQGIGHPNDGQVLVNDLDIVRSKQILALECVAAWLLPARIHPVSEVEAVVPRLRMRLYRSLRNEVR